jgi:hypothetical protein
MDCVESAPEHGKASFDHHRRICASAFLLQLGLKLLTLININIKKKESHPASSTTDNKDRSMGTLYRKF